MTKGNIIIAFSCLGFLSGLAAGYVLFDHLCEYDNVSPVLQMESDIQMRQIESAESEIILSLLESRE